MVKNTNKKSKHLTSISIRFDDETLKLIDSLSDTVAFQTGGAKNRSNTIRYLLKNGTGSSIKPKFVRLNDEERNYLNGLVTSLTSEVTFYRNIEQGIGNNFNQYTHLAHLNQLPTDIVERLKMLNDDYQKVEKHLSEVNENLRKLRLILNANLFAEIGDQSASDTND